MKQVLNGQETLALFDAPGYRRLYDESLSNPEGFWLDQAALIDWIRAPKRAGEWSFIVPVKINWYADGLLNVSANCIDRHLASQPDKIAILWEGDTPGTTASHTYRALHQAVCRLANVLKSHGVRRGDTVTIYMPMIPEAAFAMLACARIGAVHSVVFGGFSAASLSERIRDCGSRIVITADGSHRGGKAIACKAVVDSALAECPDVTSVLVARHTGEAVAWSEGRDHWLDTAMASASAGCEPEAMGAEDPLFILYTSGSTGRPKGVLHTTGGYLVYAALTHRLAFDLQPDDIYWCTADIGWITGHSYGLYGPLANGATTLMFEGIPTWPDAARCWDIVDRHKVSLFYTAPTAIRALMREGDQWLEASSRDSLRILGTVGEPINPDVWRWYAERVGKGRCTVVDTWWQTETGGHMILPLPGTVEAKPGSAGLPFFGIEPVLVDANGAAVQGEGEGNLCIAQSWPGQARTLYGDHKRFEETYFAQYPECYFSGDGARRDADGHYWITGRVDDVLNVSGHRIGTAEVESALVLHPSIAEAAVVGVPHDVKGEAVYAFVTPVLGVEASAGLRNELLALVRKQIGPIASPDTIQFTVALPKTRSGKIMRRLLRKIAAGQTEELGDVSTLADPVVVEELVRGRS